MPEKPSPVSIKQEGAFPVFLSSEGILMMFQYVTLDLLCQPI